jgi:hypothetical protein
MQSLPPAERTAQMKALKQLTVDQIDKVLSARTEIRADVLAVLGSSAPQNSVGDRRAAEARGLTDAISRATESIRTKRRALRRNG